MKIVRFSVRLFQLIPIISSFATTTAVSGSSVCQNRNSFLPSTLSVLFSPRNMSTTGMKKLPQPTEASKAKMLQLVDNNHCEFDINYYQFFANHMPHAICSLYSLGATPSRLEDYYKWYGERLVPLREPKFKVTDDNWTEYIGDKYAYVELLDFFDKKVTAHGIQKSLDTYLPRLIPGMIGAALHPVIHIGYALEYDLPRVLAEGLAYACTGYHKGGEVIDTLPEEEPQSKSSNAVDLLNKLRSLPITETFRQGSVEQDLDTILSKYGDQIKSMLSSWDVRPFEAKLDELSHATILAYFGSYRHSSLGFFLAHTLTGNHAVRVLLPHVKDDKQKARLLKMNLLALLGIYTIEGRPEFSQNVIEKFAEGKEIDWNQLVSRTIECEDEHEIKVLRSLLVIKNSVPDSTISHKLLDQSAYMMVNTIQKENEWIFKGIGYLSQD